MDSALQVHASISPSKTLQKLGFDTSKHKIAFCGLTGWGKSTCINALLRQQNQEDRNCTTAAYVNDFGEGTLTVQCYPLPLPDRLGWFSSTCLGWVHPDTLTRRISIRCSLLSLTASSSSSTAAAAAGTFAAPGATSFGSGRPTSPDPWATARTRPA